MPNARPILPTGDAMTAGIPNLARQLEPFLENVEEYRANAKMLATLASQASHQVSNEVLLRVEEISDDIQSDIARLNELIKAQKTSSPTDIALTTEVADALRLVLLEITETGTKLYSVRSEVP